MNAPDNRDRIHTGPLPACLLREQPARFGWWSDRSLMIVKGEQTLVLDADDIRALARFVDGCGAGGLAKDGA